MKANRLSFALLLPALEIAVWLLLVPTQTGLIYWHLRQTNSAKSHSIVVGSGIVYTPADSSASHPIFDLALNLVTFPRANLVTAINVPGVFVEALVSLPSAWPDTLHPAALSPDSWRAIVMPFYCLPFWWFVGVGLDTVQESRRLSWGWLLLGTVFFLATATLLLGLRFGMSEAERGETKEWVFSGLSFWAVAFAVFPTAWILQRRRAKQTESLAMGAGGNSAPS
jgi:hypothetical protein